MTRQRLSLLRYQPQFGQTGFLHGEPTWDKPLLMAAKERLFAKSGLQADFTVRASGYITITTGGDYSSFVHATLLYASDVTGTLLPEKSYNTVGWYTVEEINKLDLIPSMSPLLQILANPAASPFFDLHFALP